MIQADNVSKSYGDIKAIDSITTTIEKGSIYGLIGSNGAGKSTFLRMVAGVFKPDIGSVTLEGETTFENEEIKRKIFYISDDQYFKPTFSAKDVKEFYSFFYPKFDDNRYKHLLKAFGLDEDRKIRTFSKGMKKQLSVIYAVCSGADYLLCDETFDGLDPVARQSVKSLLANDVIEKQITPILASHNLRELEDICDHVGLMHRGGVLFSKDINDMKLGVHKFQMVLKENTEINFAIPLSEYRTGSLMTVILKGDREELTAKIKELNPVFLEALPLTLEEIFISEMEVKGYDIKKLIF